MANYPTKAVKKFTKPAHREIAAGILIAYGLFPRTQDGYDQAQKLIAGRETWLAPSNLPNYYDDIESDLMTGRETAGIINIRMVLTEFYGLDDKPVSTKKLNTGTTSVYKPEDKFVDDKIEELDQKLEETSDRIMDAVDALIEQQKQAFEEFKRQEAEKVKQRIAGREQYSEPIGPKQKSKEFGYNQYETAIGPLPMQGPKQAPKKTSSSDDDEWESEVNDQLGTKLDELIEQVKNDPLPQASTNRRKTKGKTPVKRRKLLGDSAGLSTTISEIHQNIVDTKETLFNLYKVESERFALRKKTDSELSTLLKSKARESSLEGNGLKPEGEKEKDDDDKKSDTVFDKAVSAGLISAVTAFILPLALNAMRPFFKSESDELEKQLKEPDDGEVDAIAEETRENTEATATSPEAAPPAEQTPVEQSTPAASPTPVQSSGSSQPASPLQLPNTSIPGDYDYRPNQGAPLRAAAKGGKFTPQGKHEKLKPIQKQDAKQPEGVKKLLKPMLSAITLPMKAAAFGPLLLAKTILSPFASFLPPQAIDFVKGIFDNVAKSAGLSGFDFSITSAGKGLFERLVELVKSIFQPLFDIFKSSPRSSSPGGNAGNTNRRGRTTSGSSTTGGGGTTGSSSQKEVASTLQSEFKAQGLSAEGAKLATAEIGRENSLNKGLILGSHDDGGKTAYGAVSWQGGREKVLFDELKARGIDPSAAGLAGSGNEGIKANAAAMVKEIKARGHTELLNLLKKPTLTDAEKDKVRQLFKDQYFVYNESIPIQRSRDWYETVDKLGTPTSPPKPPPKADPPTPRPRTMGRSAALMRSRQKAEQERLKTQKPTLPVGTSTDKQPGA